MKKVISSPGSVEQISPELQRELAGVYGSASELLRHFWACFPPRTPTLVAKLHTLHQTLHSYHQSTLKPFQVTCTPLLVANPSR